MVGKGAAKLFRDIASEARWQLPLDRSEAWLFSKLVALGSGTSMLMEGWGTMGEAMVLGLMADRNQI
jgi:hypothetical protein